MLTWLLTALSLVGVVLNIRKQRASFGVWLFTNGAWAVILSSGLNGSGGLIRRLFWFEHLRSLFVDC